MKGLLAAIRGLGFAAATFSMVGTAHALMITTSGAWENPTGTAAGVNGAGSDRIAWGIPSTHHGGQSSWMFQGVTDFALPDSPSGFVFKIGTFTHNNFPIYGFDFTGADLVLNLTLVGGSTFGQDFTYRFGHQETPNVAPCSVPGPTVCPDIVTIPVATASESVTIDGSTYGVSILGFRDRANGPVAAQLVTGERHSNSTMLFAQLTKMEVPEPGTLALFAVGLIGLVAVSRRRQPA